MPTPVLTLQDHAPAPPALPSRFILQFSGKLLCLVCATEINRRVARFHILHCRERMCEPHVVVDGQEMSQ